MVDKIYGGKGFGPLNSVSYGGKASSAKTADSSKSTSDRVDFSSALQNAAKTQAASTTQETTRTEKLQALKAQIDSGTYEPDLDKVASSLLPFIMKDI